MYPISYHYPSSYQYSTMVVAIRQQTTEEQSSEMISSQKQRNAAELAAAQSASLHEDPPLPPPSSTTRRKRKDPRDLGTPPRDDNIPPSIVSVDKEAPSSPSSLDKSCRPQLPTRQQIHNNNISYDDRTNTSFIPNYSPQTIVKWRGYNSSTSSTIIR